MPIAFFGIPEAVDMPQHFKFAQTYYESLTTGDGFPNWAGNENFGYGDVGIRFYPPLEYYFLAVAGILVGNWYDAAWMTFVFWMVSGCLGVYFWTRCWLSKKESAVAACFYAVIPFHLNQLYISFNNYSEFAAASILTFCFAFLTRIFKRDKISDVHGLAIFYALLILTHLPLTIIGSLCLLVYALTFLRRSNFIQPFIKCVIACGIALSASAFYWVGMITEMSWLKHVSEKFSGGRFSFNEGFFPFYYHAVFFSETAWIIDFAAILTFLFLTSAVVYFLFKKRGNTDDNPVKNVFQTVLPLGLFAFFMVTPLSRPIWEIITPLQKVQFPARWMTIVSMCGAVVAAASVHYLLKGNFLKQRVWSYGCLVFISTVALYNFIYIFHPTSFAPISREKFDNQMQELSENQSFNCWWSVWSKADALKIKEKISVETRQAKIISWEAEKKIFQISTGNDAKARIATFYYPLWQATVNGNPVEIEKDENGAILIPVSSEKSTVELSFQESLPVRVASILSLLTWLFLGGFLTFLFGKKLFSSKQFV
ncbi:MAG: 6-pyruvoyl-tetrahydropterin synthase-related protein [Acidobacteriota bacterium]|nr:6-pyruvoyl-tetrahydropterin synthase-related protein [Acidobacteriota bacterium]